MAATPNPDAETFAKYLEGKKILVCDPSSSARSGLFKIFQELGAKQNQIVLVNAFKQAQQQIAEIKPHIVIAEYELGRRCGLDLLQNQREQMPKESKEMVFVVVTCNTSQTAVAKAAEEDIDAFIIKPFTPEVVRKTILRAAIAKIQPSDYVLAVEAGKKELDAKNFDAADGHFVRALSLDPSPSLAYYYLGQSKFLREVMNEAKGSYSDGLNLNKIHYKCLVGLYELLMKEKNHQQAYEVVKRISQYFPANPKRLAEVLRLAITNGKYEDVERYYAVFCNIDDRDETLIKYICAALVVCGRYYLNSGSRSRALELFVKAAATGTGRVKILREIVQALVDFGLTKESKEFLGKFPGETHGTAEFLLMKFKVINLEGNLPAIVEFGRAILSKGVFDQQVYEIMIARSIESNTPRAVESLFYEAIQKFPAKKAHFEEMVQGHLKAS